MTHSNFRIRRCFAAFVLCGVALAQVAPPEPSVSEETPATPVAPKAVDDPSGYTKSDQKRVFGMMPNFRATSIDPVHAPSLTVKEKFQLATHDAFDRSAFLSTALNSGLIHGFGQYYSLGGGPKGYAKRFGLTYADTVQGAFMLEAVMPSLLHQDPRYFRKGEGSGWGRSGYAFSRLVVTRCDSRKLCFNASEFAGQLASSGISNLYYPSVERTYQNTVIRFGTSLATDALNNMLREFLPDLVNRIQRRKSKQAATSTPSAAGH